MEYQTIITIIGAIFIAMIFMVRFNTWAPVEDKAKLTNPPRHFTTWGRYTRYALLYVAANEILYLLIIWFPDIAKELVGFATANNIIIPELHPESLRENIPLWSVIITTTVLPSLPQKFNVDYYLRKKLHRRAFITAEADSIIQDLKLNFEKFTPQDSVIQKVMGQGAIGTEKADYLKKRNTVSHKWAKLSYLIYLFQRWETGREVRRFLDFYGEEWRRLSTDYEDLKLHIPQYRAQSGTQTNNKIVELLEGTLSRALDDKLDMLYMLITCGVLSTSRTLAQRRSAFAHFGLHPGHSIDVPFDWDTIIKSAGIVFLATLVPTMFYEFFADPSVIASRPDIPDPRSPTGTAIWSVISLLLQGSAIAVAVYLNRLWLKYRSNLEGDDEVNSLRPSVLRRSACALSAYLVGLAVLFVSAELMSGQAASLIEILGKIWAWPLASAVTGYFVCQYITTFLKYEKGGQDVSEDRKWWTALTHGVALMGTSVASTLFYFNRLIGTAELPFLIFVVATTFIIGCGIGYVFPEGYRKRRYELNRREERRFPITGEVEIQDPAGQSVACKIGDVSVTGARLDTAVKQSVGDTIQVRISQLGMFLARIVRLESSRTYIEFLHDSDTKQKLSDYVLAHAGGPG